MSWQMIEPTRAGDNDLFRRPPAVSGDPICNDLSGLNVRCLHIDGADAKLLVAKQTAVMWCHIMFDEIEVAFDLTD
jgi:hypothetical protein